MENFNPFAFVEAIEKQQSESLETRCKTEPEESQPAISSRSLSEPAHIAAKRDLALHVQLNRSRSFFHWHKNRDGKLRKNDKMRSIFGSAKKAEKQKKTTIFSRAA